MDTHLFLEEEGTERECEVNRIWIRQCNKERLKYVGGKTRGRASETACFIYLACGCYSYPCLPNSNGLMPSPVGLGQGKMYLYYKYRMYIIFIYLFSQFLKF